MSVDKDKGYRWVSLALSVAFALYDRIEIHPALWHRTQWKIYSRAAEWCGRRAIDSEAKYWDEVKQ